MMQYFLPLLVLMALISGCHSIGTESVEPSVQNLRWLDAADPDSDALQAIKVQDFRLLGFVTRSLEVPGLKKEDIPRYRKQYGLQLIEGISNVVRNDEHLRLMSKARSYAQQYNRNILDYLNQM